jgi:hypothetical protein
MNRRRAVLTYCATAALAQMACGCGQQRTTDAVRHPWELVEHQLKSPEVSPPITLRIPQGIHARTIGEGEPLTSVRISFLSEAELDAALVRDWAQVDRIAREERASRRQREKGKVHDVLRFVVAAFTWDRSTPETLQYRARSTWPRSENGFFYQLTRNPIETSVWASFTLLGETVPLFVTATIINREFGTNPLPLIGKVERLILGFVVDNHTR